MIVLSFLDVSALLFTSITCTKHIIINVVTIVKLTQLIMSNWLKKSKRTVLSFNKINNTYMVNYAKIVTKVIIASNVIDSFVNFAKCRIWHTVVSYQ